MSAETPAELMHARPAHQNGSGQPSFLQRFWLPIALVVAGIVVVTAMGFEAAAVVQLLMDPEHGGPALVGATPG